MRVSEYFHLNRHQGELDFVDVDIRGDTRVYVDPRALRLLTTDWGQECVSLIQHFFRTVLDAIRRGDDARARSLLAGLREPNETHLGLSRDRARGSALGDGLAEDVWESLSETDAAVTGLLQDLEETALLVPGIDRDRISDIATNISLHDAVAKPSGLWLRSRTLNRLQRLIRQRLEYGLQGCGGVCTVS